MKAACTWILACSHCLLTSASLAQQTPSLQELLENQSGVKSRESEVSIGNSIYRKIEVEGKSYYLSFKGKEQNTAELFCDRPGQKEESLIEGSLKVENRKVAFVKLLSEQCDTLATGQTRRTVSLGPEVGFYLPEKPGDRIKKKQIGVDPTNPTGVKFSGEF